MKKIYIEYDEAKKLIQEGDILLYRPQSIISYLIKRVGEGLYSHIGLASWHKYNGDSLLETVEFKEFKGGRSVNLLHEVKKYSGKIDVYRVSPAILKLVFNKETQMIESKKIIFDPKVVTKNMRKMSGLPYGFTRIWWIAKHKMLGLRLLYDIGDTSDDSTVNDVYPVCSTAAAASFSKAHYDIIHQKSDQWTEPSDFAKSGITHYLFTLVKNSK